MIYEREWYQSFRPEIHDMWKALHILSKLDDAYTSYHRDYLQNSLEIMDIYENDEDADEDYAMAGFLFAEDEEDDDEEEDDFQPTYENAIDEMLWEALEDKKNHIFSPYTIFATYSCAAIITEIFVGIEEDTGITAMLVGVGFVKLYYETVYKINENSTDFFANIVKLFQLDPTGKEICYLIFMIRTIMVQFIYQKIMNISVNDANNAPSEKVMDLFIWFLSEFIGVEFKQQDTHMIHQDPEQTIDQAFYGKFIRSIITPYHPHI